MRLRTLAPSVLLLLSASAGCGSDEAAQPAPRPEGDEVRQGVLTRCRGLAERLCSAARPCCERHGDYSFDRCLARYVRETCNPAASAVAEGLATYDEAAEESCFAAREAIFQTCEGDWEEIVASRAAVWSACNVVEGTRQPGQSCGSWAMCARPEGAAGVDCQSGVCSVISSLGAGEACPYPNGDVPTCGPGLFCSAGAQGELGTCELATPEGGACNPILQNPECGLGYYCDQAAAVCRRATNFGGPSCVQGTECVSFICDRAAADCTEARTLAFDFCKP